MAGIKDLIPQSPLVGPPVPRGVTLTWEQLGQTIRGEGAGLLDAIKPFGEPLVLPDAVYLTYKSISSASFDATLLPGTLAKWMAVVEKRVTAEGQFPQWTVLYSNVSPPPFFWDYKCMKCRAWGGQTAMPDGLSLPLPSGENTCRWVSGRISPQGWCALWCPPGSYKKFTWPKELLKGNW